MEQIRKELFGVGRGSLSTMQLATALSLAFATVLIFRVGWITEDAFITFRTMDNFVNGYGLRWNVNERVQSFTNPLWMFVVTIPYYFTREAVYTSFVVSLFCSLAALFVVFTQVAKCWQQVVIAGTALLLSRAFVEFSSSGLENPLSYFLLTLFVSRFLATDKGRHRILHLSLLVSLLMLNRLDNALFVAPAMAYEWWRDRKSAATHREFALGLVPIAAWVVFSIVYYGFPFPNTYYAKLNTGLANSAYLFQGLKYLINFTANDPLGFALIVLALGASLILPSPLVRALGLGLLLHIGYVVRIGGDFMSGRFFSISVLMAVILVLQMPIWEETRNMLLLLAASLVLGLLNPTSPLYTDAKFSNIYIDEAGIADERGHYFQKHGITPLKKYLPASPDVIPEPSVEVFYNMGTKPFGSGPNAHFIDEFALTDPLLARLPAVYDPRWRIGHMRRAIPEGYPESALTGANHFNDLELGKFWEKIRLVTRGPIFGRERLMTLIKLNLGVYDHLVSFDRYRFQSSSTTSLKKIQTRLEKNGPGSITQKGLKIELGEDSHKPIVNLTAAGTHPFALVFITQREELATIVLGIMPDHAFHTYRVRVPQSVVRRGYTSLYFRSIESYEERLVVSQLSLENSSPNRAD